jgi:chemotaxis signal transduction protein
LARSGSRCPHRSGTVLLGLAAFRGEILPCCSLSRILDLPVSSESSESSERSEPSAARTLILQDAFGRRWAVPIDGVLGIRTGDSEPTEPAPPIDPQWLQGSLRDASGTAHLLDPATLFRQITLATA